MRKRLKYAIWIMAGFRWVCGPRSYVDFTNHGRGGQRARRHDAGFQLADNTPAGRVLCFSAPPDLGPPSCQARTPAGRPRRGEPMHTEPVIRIEKLTIRYGDFVAVDRLDLELTGGELFGLLGPNGAGKSSTLRVLIGQRPPTEGRVTVLGRDVVRDWADIKPLFGYVPDRENHFEEFTGRRSLLLFAGLYNVPAPRVLECLERVELDE